jgi:hypothetical protein
MVDVELGRTEIDALARKVQSFGQRLTEEERTLLHAVFTLAHEGLVHRIEAQKVTGFRKPHRDVGLRASGQDLSSLSKAFKNTFHSGPPAGLGTNPVLFTPVPIPDG